MTRQPRSQGVQLSINADEDLHHHLELGAKLATLRERGVLIVVSGNVVHNLRAVNGTLTDDGYDWAQRFDEDARARPAALRKDSPMCRRRVQHVTAPRH